MFACSGILFNHESPLRPPRFVTRKIISTVVRISLGSHERLTLGSLSIYRDWGWAPDYVEAMWLMLQQTMPDDYVIATGQSYSLQDFVRLSFSEVGLNWKDYVDFDSKLCRPSEIKYSCGDITKASIKLGWMTDNTLPSIIKKMIAAEKTLQCQ
jgi:GDPmannose 4,6-dehydratase